MLFFQSYVFNVHNGNLVSFSILVKVLKLRMGSGESDLGGWRTGSERYTLISSDNLGKVSDIVLI